VKLAKSMEDSLGPLGHSYGIQVLVEKNSESGVEKISCLNAQCLGNRFDHIDRRGMLCVLDLSNIAAIDVRAMRKGFLAEPFGLARLLNI
jgi:hypothetical protein